MNGPTSCSVSPVLEHVDDLSRAVKELFRVCRSDGVVLASMHGALPWHPYPQDHWRWTQTGLPLLFRAQGGFQDVKLSATRGTVSGSFFLLAHYGYNWASRGPLRRHWSRRSTARESSSTAGCPVSPT